MTPTTPGAAPEVDVATSAEAVVLNLGRPDVDRLGAALQALLGDDRVMDTALYVLQAIPGQSADRALMQSLSTSAGTTRIAIIATLGERRSAAAVQALVPLLQQPAKSLEIGIGLGGLGDDEASGERNGVGGGKDVVAEPSFERVEVAIGAFAAVREGDQPRDGD